MATSDRLALAFSELDLPPDPRVLVLNAQDAGLPIMASQIDHHTFLKPRYDRLVARGADVIEGFAPPYDCAVVHITKSKAESRGLIGLAYQQLATSGILIIDGQKTDGIEGRIRELKKLSDMAPTTSKSHGKITSLIKTNANSTLGEWVGELMLCETEDGFLTTPGCFSPNGADIGSQLLAAHFENLSGHLADFGGGWGYLSKIALSQNSEIERLDLFEAYAPALDCATRNIEDARLNLNWEDVTTLSDQSFDTIIMNPPFHQGRGQDLSLGQAFIQSAARNLHKRGQLLMVANRQLAYEATLSAAFKKIEPLRVTQGFKIIRASQPA